MSDAENPAVIWWLPVVAMIVPILLFGVTEGNVMHRFRKQSGPRRRGGSTSAPSSSLPSCPICGKDIFAVEPFADDLFPFCSTRCRQIDLLRWCTGQYAIVEPLSPEELDRHLQDQLQEENETPHTADWEEC